MRKFSTLLGVGCAALLLFSMTGCKDTKTPDSPADPNTTGTTAAGDPDTPDTPTTPASDNGAEKSYADLQKAMDELKALEADVTMTMKLDIDEEEQDIRMAHLVKIRENSDTDVDMSVTLTATLPGLEESVTQEMAYVDGWFYLNSTGQKGKMEMDLPTAAETIGETVDISTMTTLPELKSLKDLKTEKSGEDTILTYTLDGDALASLMKTSIGTLFGESEVNLGDTEATGKIVIGADGLMKTMSMSLNVQVDMGGAAASFQTTTDTVIKATGDKVVITVPEGADAFPEMAF